MFCWETMIIVFGRLWRYTIAAGRHHDLPSGLPQTSSKCCLLHGCSTSCMVSHKKSKAHTEKRTAPHINHTCSITSIWSGAITFAAATKWSCSTNPVVMFSTPCHWGPIIQSTAWGAVKLLRPGPQEKDAEGIRNPHHVSRFLSWRTFESLTRLLD